MWITSISPPNLSLMDPPTTEIYYRTGITENTNTQRQTHTETEADTLPMYQIRSSKSRILQQTKLKGKRVVSRAGTNGR